MERVAVRFEPSGAVCWAEPGSTVLEAARLAGVTVPAPCGGRAVCGSCGVRVTAGELAEPDEAERAGLRRAPDGVRLACRARVVAAVTIKPLVGFRTELVSPQRATGPLVAGVDLGTTNVAATVLELDTGREVASGWSPNAQATWGADVLTRLSAALAGDADALKGAARDSVLGAVSAAGVAPERIARWVIAGNTTMAALLTGTDVTPLAGHPFALPAIRVGFTASELLGDVGGDAEVLIVPPLAGFVGGDIGAGLLGTGVWRSGARVLLVDVGTNAEIALMYAGVLHVASAAAGPAFDGPGVSCAGPLADGAVVAVRRADDVLEPVVHGGGDPRWFSGSGIVSLLSVLLDAGHLDESGLLLREGPLEHLMSVDEAGVLRLCPFAGPLCLTQLDVRAIQLAKAAVRVGIDTVLRSAGVDASDLDALLVAGAFGAALHPDDLVRIGMVPAATREVMTPVGNTSLQGAIAIALAPALASEAAMLARSALQVDLAGTDSFQRDLLAALALRPTG